MAQRHRRVEQAADFPAARRAWPRSRAFRGFGAAGDRLDSFFARANPTAGERAAATIPPAGPVKFPRQLA